MNQCKCDTEYGDYGGCSRHGDGTQWAKMQEGKPYTTAVAHELAELKKSHASELEKLKDERAGNKDSIENLALINSELGQTLAESREGRNNDQLKIQLEQVRPIADNLYKAQAALKAKEEELSRCLKALDSEEGKHRLTQGELADLRQAIRDIRLPGKP